MFYTVLAVLNRLFWGLSFCHPNNNNGGPPSRTLDYHHNDIDDDDDTAILSRQPVTDTASTLLFIGTPVQSPEDFWLSHVGRHISDREQFYSNH